ncbi:hypothetical protein SAMN04489724_0702 [Algoriphagus locisalis]|uniref:Dolichyl-phosphate-mannose-protein mannosyltransferase n=1 Tax=Algoriphagus locisalis TaxID=305507 RepID=A0A1I6XVM2_9BACT|nr:hypothetical protein [Algoriphagus locisalis]SFT42565.1 hypothetical protein SAMN04489724_0702 [Algoriphagus locisalis]
MNLVILDYFIFGCSNLLVLSFLIFRYKQKIYSKLEVLLVVLLWLVHFTFSLVFALYILRNGGDSYRYWTVTADSSQYASTWMEHFGVNTFFIQWLNYLPYKALGLSYLSGSVLYAMISYAGLLLLFEGIRYLISLYKDSLAYSQLLYLPLFLPGLHFWTAGVSKESLLFFGLGLMFYAFSVKKNQPFLVLTGWMTCLLVRPFIGFMFLPILAYYLFLFLKKRSFVIRFRVIVIMALVLFKAVQHFVSYLHLEDFTWQKLRNLSDSQLRFLTEYNANTELPMGGMNTMERWFAVTFRPLIWESWDFLSLVFAMENSFLLLILILGIGFSWKKAVQMPFSIKYYTIIAFAMFLIFTFTLNNMGLFYRMKSIWLPFVHLTFLWLICSSSLRSENTSIQ